MLLTFNLWRIEAFQFLLAGGRAFRLKLAKVYSIHFICHQLHNYGRGRELLWMPYGDVVVMVLE